MKSLINSYTTTVEFLVLAKITGSLPYTSVYNINVPNNIKIAYPSFDKPGTVDVLVGADTYWDVMCTDKFKTNVHDPHLQKTLFDGCCWKNFSFKRREE